MIGDFDRSCLYNLVLNSIQRDRKREALPFKTDDSYLLKTLYCENKIVLVWAVSIGTVCTIVILFIGPLGLYKSVNSN